MKAIQEQTTVMTTPITQNVVVGHIFPTLDIATDIMMRRFPGLRLKLFVGMQMEILSLSMTRKPMTSLPLSQLVLMIITITPGLEQGGLTSTVTGGGAMEALGTTATGALGNPLI